MDEFEVDGRYFLPVWPMYFVVTNSDEVILTGTGTGELQCFYADPDRKTIAVPIFTEELFAERYLATIEAPGGLMKIEDWDALINIAKVAMEMGATCYAIDYEEGKKYTRIHFEGLFSEDDESEDWLHHEEE